MGLLDQIVGGIAANALGRSPLGSLGRRGSGTGSVLAALLPVVLAMLANRSAAGGAGGSGGGLLGGLFGPGGGLGGGSGNAGTGMGTDGGLGGGLGGLIEQFTRKGYGQQAASWVGTGANEPLTPDAVADVFGHDDIAQIAQQAGVSSDEARSGLAELLPDVVDRFTPQGQLPGLQQLSSSVDDYLKRLDS